MLAAVLALVVRMLVWGAPLITYKVRARSMASKCSAVQKGMTVLDARNLMYVGTPPFQESISGNSLTFSSWYSCRIDFDEGTQTVTGARMLEGPGIP